MDHMMEYHVEAMARELAETHPDVQRVRDEMRAKLMTAMQDVRGSGRQNRSSADDEPMPAIKIDRNPLGMQKPKKGR